MLDFIDAFDMVPQKAFSAKKEEEKKEKITRW